MNWRRPIDPDSQWIETLLQWAIITYIVLAVAAVIAAVTAIILTQLD